MCSHEENGSMSNLRHDAFVYGSDDEFVARVAPFLRAGLAEGSPTLAVTTPDRWALLRKALGTSAEQVSFTDRADWYVSPQTSLDNFNAKLHDLVREGADSVRVFAEISFDSDPETWMQWTEYEAIVDDALSKHPAWIVCGYDRSTLDATLIDAAWETHTHVLEDGWHGLSRAA
jgi:hypothetical protein